jgi:hypothetical protein
MANDDTPRMPDGRELLRGMGWESLPYGCVGLLRHREVSSNVVWSWLILVPWAGNDTKPWIDGNHTFEHSLLTMDQQQDRLLQHMRDLLDERYGESVGRRAADDLIERIFNEE